MLIPLSGKFTILQVYSKGVKDPFSEIVHRFRSPRSPNTRCAILVSKYVSFCSLIDVIGKITKA